MEETKRGWTTFSSAHRGAMGRKTKRPRAEGEAPKKCDFRQRAHSNPLADVGEDGHPTHPSRVDWHASFPQHFAPLAPLDPGGAAPLAAAAPARAVEWVDVGCGYGGLLMSMATEFPDKLMLGMEIRHKVAEFAHEKIVSLRREQEGKYQNVDVIQTNTMKYVPQFFFKGQLEKMMFCFPDPHFKKNTHRRRIISADMNAEYAYCLREGGLAYIVTDVLELYEWMVRYLEEHPLFDRLTSEEEAADPVVPFIRTRTDESIKVERNQGQKYSAVYRRRADASGWGLVAADCHASGAARILAEARLSGHWIATADGCPGIAGRDRAYAVQHAMCTLAPDPGSAAGQQHTERGKVLGECLGRQCGWKLLTEWSSDDQAKASSVGAAVNGETHAAAAAKEKLQAAAEAVPTPPKASCLLAAHLAVAMRRDRLFLCLFILSVYLVGPRAVIAIKRTDSSGQAAKKGGKGQQIRVPLFSSAIREAETALVPAPRAPFDIWCQATDIIVSATLGIPIIIVCHSQNQ